ncbi:MAG: DUF2892 domain-containing protein [Gammaproteobacteria bacterium]|nr:DUF2892 domain-containing protein [Gammaproteobacteria bacterium]
MTINRIVHLFAGIMILISIALAHFIHPYWIGLAAFVGVNLAQSGVTNFCPLYSMLKKAGVKE